MAASELDTAGEDSLEYWCQGCLRVGERPLVEQERAWILALCAGHQRRMLFGLALVPASVLLTVLLVVLLPTGQAGTWVAGIMGIATLGIALPVAIALVRDHATAKRQLSDDLAHGTVWLFQAPLEAREMAGADLHLVGEGVAPPLLMLHDFELLHTSLRLVNPADHSLSLARGDVIEVEPHTGSQLYAPLSLRVVDPTPDTEFGQRALSATERAELARIARRLMVPAVGTVLAIAMLVLIVTMLKSFRPELKHAPLGDFLSTAVAIALCIRVLVRHARGMKLAIRMREDLRLGLVVHVMQVSKPPQEFLPASRLLWRSAGAPALWRDQRKAVTRLRSGL